MGLKFTKMHGLGNDFMVLDGVRQHITLSASDIATLSHPHTGIGFDQCLIIEPAIEEGVDFNYRIFNADGQEVGQCGNGARCLARFARHYGLTKNNQLTVATKTTRMQLHINDDNTVSVMMGMPRLAPQDIPLRALHEAEHYLLSLPEGAVSVHALSVGNPHAVLRVADVNTAPVAQLGAQICTHPDFPEHANVGFMQIVAPNHLRLRVYERGCGETLACGSGAVAAAAVARLFYQADADMTVSLLGGDLTMSWPNMQAGILMSGPAVFVYEGELFP